MSTERCRRGSTTTTWRTARSRNAWNWASTTTTRTTSRRRPTDRSPSFADDIPRGLVLAQPMEARVAQHAVAGPLGEPDLCDQLRAYPMHVSLAHRVALERRTVHFTVGELRTECPQHRVAEPGADLARVDEDAAVVVAEQQRTEPGAAALRLGPAADDELLVPDALELEPVLRPTTGVRRRRAFGDDALVAARAGGTEHLLAGALAMRGEPQGLTEAHRVPQQLL